MLLLNDENGIELKQAAKDSDNPNSIWEDFHLLLILFLGPRPITFSSEFFWWFCHTTSHFTTPHPMNMERRW